MGASLPCIVLTLLLVLLRLSAASLEEAAATKATSVFHPQSHDHHQQQFLLQEEEIVHAIELLQSWGVEPNKLCRSRIRIRSKNYDIDSADIAKEETILRAVSNLLPFCHEEEEFKETYSYNSVNHSSSKRHLVEMESEPHSNTRKEIFQALLGAAIMIAIVAVISGLFMGLMTLEPLTLQIKIRTTDDEEERKDCEALLPIVEQNHRVLITLLLLDGIAYEALPLFLDNIMPTYLTIILSVTLVLFFGEIVPCAIFAGPNQVSLAVKFLPVMKFLFVLVAPIAVPLAKLLDYIVDGGEENGHDGTEDAYNRKELTALIRIQNEHDITKPKIRKFRHATHRQPSNGDDEVPVDNDRRTWNAFKNEIMEAVETRLERQQQDPRQRKYSEDYSVDENQISPPLHEAEVNMVEGALQMKTKLAMDVYTPLRMMFAIPSNMILTKPIIMDIYSEGYSRVPVYHAPESVSKGSEDNLMELQERHIRYRTSICGLLLTRQLMVIDWDDEREVSTLPLIKPRCVSPRMNLVDLLLLLQAGGCLMAFVCAQPDLATKALKADKPIPVEAGFMGLVTLEDVMEALLQDRIHDEGDIRDRDREAARLTRWAATKIQKFMKEKRAKLKAAKAKANQNQDHSMTSETSEEENRDVEKGLAGRPNETTPLLS